ncbi:MAG: hypothetical protein NC418_06705 [Muribaculaceae bacterium]|nr:hypothetical protein [Muribaculaceae bacterium]
MTQKRLLSAMAIIAMGASSLFAAEYYVAAGGKDSNAGTQAAPFGSPEMALMCAVPGETTTIHLEKDATFMVGALRIEDGCNVNIIGDNSTLKAAEKSHLEGGEGLRILRIGANTDVEISGVNFVNGRQVGYFPGGAIFHVGKSLKIDNCAFIDNMGSSCGGGIASRGHYLEVRNSYFAGNNVEGGGGTGAGISMIGNADAENFGELVVDNCAFYDNHIDEGGGKATAISIFDPAAGYALTGKASVTNCSFLNNTNKQAYVADVDFSDNGECEVVFVNNTMVNCEVGFNIYFQEAPVYFFNNFIFAKKTAVSSTLSIADSDRTAITAANNVLIGGENALNENMDDPMFKANNNTLGTAASHSLASFAMASTMTREGNIGFLATGPTSKLNEAGLTTSAEYTPGKNLIPATDCRGYAKDGVKCIGAYQQGGEPAGVADIIVGDDSNAPVEYYNLHGMRVAQPEAGLYIMRQGKSVKKVYIK